MTTLPDQFAQSFDAIEIDRRRAPSPAAIDCALAACAHEAPGFYLADDAGGRFVVDREFGVVSLRDEALLAAERGQVHDVRLRVVESTGDSYLLDLKLRVTGIVPQMVGAEDFGFGEPGMIAPPAAPPAPPVAWTAFAAARGLQSKCALTTQGAYGALLGVALPPVRERAAIAFESIPLSAPAHAIWSL
jgi:hypothetical protein